MSIFHEQKSFLETNAWQKSNLNSLRYNTSQVGSVIPLIYGTTRQSVNLIALGDYRGPQGKKGKVGPLPMGGTHTSAKGKGGGGGKKSAGGKKSGHYSVDVDFALCQGPVDIGAENKVWASPGTAFFQSVGLNLYTGADGQAVDPVFDGLGKHSHYSGTCHVTGTPMDLGNSPVVPNISFEITGFEVGTISSLPNDANPAHVIKDFLTNARYGAGWPPANLDPDITTVGSNNYGDYCRASGFGISPALTSQTDAATWISELARLTGIAILWSGSILKFIPYIDIEISCGGGVYTPTLTPLYALTDDDFLPWSPHIDATEPVIGEDDPVLITRSNPADATNWMSMEYLDRANDYNKTLVPKFDQSSIDRYGLRTEAAINGSCFCEKAPAEASLQLLLQRSLYVRNTYRFQLGWQFCLLEPMDLVLLTDTAAALDRQPVRITAIEENENGDLIFDAEEFTSGFYPADDPNEMCRVPGPTGTSDGCLLSFMEFRGSTPYNADLEMNTPDRLDSSGNYYVNDLYLNNDDRARVYGPDGAEIANITYEVLWDRIHAFCSVDGTTPVGDETADHYSYYRLMPIRNGTYILACIVRFGPGTSINGDSAFWALLEPGTLSVLGVYYYEEIQLPPFHGCPDTHVYEVFSNDQAILVQGYASLTWTDAVIVVLPSINEFLDGLFGMDYDGEPFRIKPTMLYPFGGATSSDTGFGHNLSGEFSGSVRSKDFGFLLPAADGTRNLYMYFNRDFMDYIDTNSSVPAEFKDVIQPAYPNGCMIKIPLGDVNYSDASAGELFPGQSRFYGAPTGGYSIDNANWIDGSGATAIPFLDEHINIIEGTTPPTGGDCYSQKVGAVDRGKGKFWLFFFMVGNADARARSRTADYEHPIYERVRVFEYMKETEIARQIGEATCLLHPIDDIPPDAATATWEEYNDAHQIFTVTDNGRTATVYIHSYLWKRAFMQFTFPLDVCP